MGNEGRKSHCSQKELQRKQWVMMEDSLFRQGVTMQTTGNQGRKNYWSHKDFQCKQLVMNKGKLIVHTRSYNANYG
ncbi:hypothetical protein KSS87_015076 [Heliosperma pusillum]|nr:hypothetical protein KSS87_010864 [Heliosperma pusillum]KAH9621973.1 hypothetical protein KSS87_015076 [Heliosperma pusillum]